MARVVCLGLVLVEACYGASSSEAKSASLADYGNLRGIGGERLNMVDRSPDADLMATFEFEDLLSYSYDYGEASPGDASTALGGFGVDFNLGNMNFGPEGSLTNTGRRDGYYVNAASFQGFEPDGTSGVSVAPAGDVDGDGMDDILIGAPGVKQAYVLFGSSGYAAFRRQLTMGSFETAINALPDDGFIILREDNDDMDSAFGSQVSTAGDINGDGYDDVLIAASNAKGYGRVYVFFGGARTTLTGHGAWDLTNSKHFPLERGFRFEGDAEFLNLGVSVAGGFDMNNDGFDDFILGVIGGSHEQQMGEVILVYGTDKFDRSILPIRNVAGTGGSMNPRGVRLSLKNKDGAGKRALVGIECAALDDVNGDGHDDVAIGASQYGTGGAVFVLFGGIQYHGTFYLDEIDGTDGFGILGANKGDNLGGDVKKAGDFNGDGYGDIVVGAPAFEHRRGAAYIILGRKHFGPTAHADITLRGDAFQDITGYSVSGAGDVDGDGLDDVLVGSFSASPQGRDMAGTIYCVLGGTKKQGIFDLADLNGFDGFKMYGEHAGDCAGYDVAAAGDFNNDGVDDLVVSAMLSNAGEVDGGNTYVIFGSQFDAKVPTTMPTGPSSMPTPAPSHSRDSLGSGKLPFPARSPLGSIEENHAGAMFHGDKTLSSVVFPGDVDGDGIDDILAAADGDAYVIYGAADDDLYAAWSGELDMIPKKKPDGTYGAAIIADCDIEVVSSAGDFNDDGFEDMALACPSNADGSGTVFIVFGGDAIKASTELSDLVRGVDYVEITGGAESDAFGSSLSYLDFNADGYTDVVIGAPERDRAYVYFGGATADAASDVVQADNLAASEGFRISHEDNSELGAAVAGIGDINDDGYDDLAVGAPGAALVCVVFGNNMEEKSLYDCGDLSPGSNTPGFHTFTNPEEGDMEVEERHVGFSVAAAGDVDGDSYADFLIGAPGLDHGSGKVFIMLGKDDWDKIENTKHAIPIVSSLRRGALGTAVAGAGDINNDGLDDILIGAANSLSSTSSEPGTAYVLYGTASLSDLSYNQGVYGSHTETKEPNQAGIDVRQLDGSDGFGLTGTEVGAMAGASVAFGSYDVNSDGVDDLVVVEPGAHQAYLLFGLSLEATPEIAPPSPTSKPTSATLGQPTTAPTTLEPTPATWPPTSTKKPTGGFPTAKPTLQPTSRPTHMPTGGFPTPMPTETPTTAFSFISVGYVQATIRITDMSAANFGSLETISVQYAVYDILFDGYITSPQNVTEVVAIDIASIDISFYLAVDSPSDLAESEFALVEDIYTLLNEAVDSGYFEERLIYWTAFFEADGNLASLDANITSSLLVPSATYFTTSNTMPPTSAPHPPTADPTIMPTDAATASTDDSAGDDTTTTGDDDATDLTGDDDVSAPTGDDDATAPTGEDDTTTASPGNDDATAPTGDDTSASTGDDTDDPTSTEGEGSDDGSSSDDDGASPVGDDGVAEEDDDATTSTDDANPVGDGDDATSVDDNTAPVDDGGGYNDPDNGVSNDDGSEGDGDAATTTDDNTTPTGDGDDEATSTGAGDDDTASTSDGGDGDDAASTGGGSNGDDAASTGGGSDGDDAASTRDDGIGDDTSVADQDPTPAPQPGTGTISTSSKSDDDDGADSASTALLVVPLVVGIFIILVALGYLYQQKKWCFAEEDAADSPAPASDGSDIAVEGESVEAHQMPVDEAEMSSAIVNSQDDLSMVEAPASMVTDVQEKIIEADL